jgi:hypothetical protein
MFSSQVKKLAGEVKERSDVTKLGFRNSWK